MTSADALPDEDYDFQNNVLKQHFCGYLSSYALHDLSGNTEENQLRSSREEELEQEQHQEMLKEEAKESTLSFDRLCNVADSSLKTSSEEQPTEEQQTCSPTVDDNIEEDVLIQDLNVDINDRPVRKAKDIIICSPELEEFVSAEKNEIPEGQYLEALSNPDLVQTETKSSSVDTHSCDDTERCNNFSEKQGIVQEAVKESNTELCHQLNTLEHVVKESLPGESTPPASNTECCQELENAEEENDGTEELSKKSQHQGATASGKKKKRKRRNKKKGGTQEDKNDQKDGKEENCKKAKDAKSVKGDNGSTTECNTDIFTTEALKESKVDQVKNEQDSQETEGIVAAETVETTESSSLKEELNDPGVHITNEHTRQSLETETIGEAVLASTKNPASVETPQETKTYPTMGKQDKEQSLETERAEKVDPVTSPTEASLGSPDFNDTTNSIVGTDVLDKRCTSSLDNSKSGGQSNNVEVVHIKSEIVYQVEGGVGTVDEIKPAYSTNNSEMNLSTRSRKNTEGESHIQSNCDIAAEEFESTDKSLRLSLSDSPDSEPPLEPSEAIKVIVREPGEIAEIVKNPETDTKQYSHPPSDNDDSSELKQDITEKKLTQNLRGSEDLVEIYSSSHNEKSDRCEIATLATNPDLYTEDSILENVAQVEQLNKITSQRLEFEDQTDESNLMVSSEDSNTTTSSNTTESPKEANEIDTAIEQEFTTSEDVQHENCTSDQENQMCPLDGQLYETSEDKPESYDASRPTKHDCDKDEGEDEEGQSFDFDDMDMEAAIAINPEEEVAEDTMEVTVSQESNNSTSQSISEPDKKTEENPAQSNDVEGNQVDTLKKEPDNFPQDDKNSLAHEATPKEEENGCEVNKRMDETNVVDESMHITEEGKDIAVGELGVVAETIKNATLAPVEEGVDAVKLEVQDNGLVFPKSEDQVASKELPPSGKDGKKYSKKGKGKNKEDCKMS